MQDRYVGDIGDFVKLSLLKALTKGQRVGIVWYLVPDESHNRDGRHVDYLKDREWRRLDPEIFDCLQRIIESGERSVGSLERLALPQGHQFVFNQLPLPDVFSDRPFARTGWLEAAVERIQECNFVFLDPDNGLEPEKFRPRSKKATKSATFADLKRFKQPGRTLLVYHHQTRRVGGHVLEIGFLANRLRMHGFERVDALRAKSYSPRAFFLLDASDEIRGRASDFARAWGADRMTWHLDPSANN
jgi:hypothetical protein